MAREQMRLKVQRDVCALSKTQVEFFKPHRIYYRDGKYLSRSAVTTHFSFNLLSAKASIYRGSEKQFHPRNLCKVESLSPECHASRQQFLRARPSETLALTRAQEQTMASQHCFLRLATDEGPLLSPTPSPTTTHHCCPSPRPSRSPLSDTRLAMIDKTHVFPLAILSGQALGVVVAVAAGANQMSSSVNQPPASKKPSPI